jgi:hypothetical protein
MADVLAIADLNKLPDVGARAQQYGQSLRYLSENGSYPKNNLDAYWMNENRNFQDWAGALAQLEVWIRETDAAILKHRDELKTIESK